FDVEPRLRVEVAVLVSEARPLPASIFPDVAVGSTMSKRLHAHLCIADTRGFLEDALQPRVRREPFAFLDAEGGQLAVVVVIAGVEGFGVNGLGHDCPELD